jgi:hypothetical protein
VTNTQTYSETHTQQQLKKVNTNQLKKSHGEIQPGKISHSKGICSTRMMVGLSKLTVRIEEQQRSKWQNRYFGTE